MRNASRDTMGGYKPNLIQDKRNCYTFENPPKRKKSKRRKTKSKKFNISTAIRIMFKG